MMSGQGIMKAMFAIASAAVVLTSPMFTTALSAGDEFRPVVILDVKGQSEDELASAIIEHATDAIREGVLATYAEQIYGTGKRFQRERAVSSAMGMVGRVFQQFDRRFENSFSEMAPRLRKLNGRMITFSIEALWVPKNLPLPTASRSAQGGHMFGMLWKLSRMAILSGHKDVASSLNLVSDVIDIPTLNADKVPEGVQSFRNYGRRAYEWLRKDQNAVPWPLRIAFLMHAVQDRVKVRFSINFKPGELRFQLAPPEPIDYLKSEFLVHMPPFYSKALPVGRFTFQRVYGRADQKSGRPTLYASFGAMIGDNVRGLTQCFDFTRARTVRSDNYRECAATSKAGGPLHIRKYAPTVPAKLRLPDSLRGGVRGSVRLKAIEKMNRYLTMFVMLNRLAFDLSDSNGIKVIPEESQIPFVVRLKKPVVGGFVYTDITKNRYGFNLFEQLVASKAALEIDMAIGDTIQQGDRVTNDKLAKIAQKILELLK